MSYGTFGWIASKHAAHDNIAAELFDCKAEMSLNSCAIAQSCCLLHGALASLRSSETLAAPLSDQCCLCHPHPSPSEGDPHCAVRHSTLAWLVSVSILRYLAAVLQQLLFNRLEFYTSASFAAYRTI